MKALKLFVPNLSASVYPLCEYLENERFISMMDISRRLRCLATWQTNENIDQNITGTVIEILRETNLFERSKLCAGLIRHRKQKAAIDCVVVLVFLIVLKSDDQSVLI